MSKPQASCVDSICESFEIALSNGSSPSLADYLNRIDDQGQRSALLERLLRIESRTLPEHARIIHSKSDLIRRHPDLAEEILPLQLGGLSDHEPVPEGVIAGYLVEHWLDIEDGYFRIRGWSVENQSSVIIHLFESDRANWVRSVCVSPRLVDT